MDDGSNFWVFRIGNTVICVLNAVAPSDQQWDEYMKVVKKLFGEVGFEAASSLSITDGGAPTGAQRSLVNDFLKGRSARTSIISSSSLVRGAVTALSWFNPAIKTFAPQRTREALGHIAFVQNDIYKLSTRLRPLAGSVITVRPVLYELEQQSSILHAK